MIIYNLVFKNQKFEQLKKKKNKDNNLKAEALIQELKIACIEHCILSHIFSFNFCHTSFATVGAQGVQASS